jgi:hypothetical protein
VLNEPINEDAQLWWDELPVNIGRMCPHLSTDEFGKYLNKPSRPQLVRDQILGEQCDSKSSDCRFLQKRDVSANEAT